MIQEKDFLYRVPVKNALVATPGQQVRNPEILVDLEGGEFMRGNMLDANSTNKLINQSVKDAVDNKFIESGYVKQDLLDAETSARTKGDEDLSAKIQAEQTRAEGKEKEISDKLAIVDGDSNTEGSFRKAIADVVAAAPEDLDTLKEIADKLAGNDDLHTALNQAITEKADASALANEVTRATGAESGLQAAINAKQNAGNYIPYDASLVDAYSIDKNFVVKTDDANTAYFGPAPCISLKYGDENTMAINYASMSFKSKDYIFSVDPGEIKQVGSYKFDVNNSDGIKWSTTDGIIYSKIDPTGLMSYMNDNCYTKCNNVDFLDIRNFKDHYVTLSPEALIMRKDSDQQVLLSPESLVMTGGSGQQVLLTLEQLLIKNDQVGSELQYGANRLYIKSDEDNWVEFGPFTNQASGGLSIHSGNGAVWVYPDKLVIGSNNSLGARVSTEFNGDGIVNTNGSISFTQNLIQGFDMYVHGYSSDKLSNILKNIYASKQDRITPTTELDLTSIDTADIESLRLIVKALATELNTLGLIKLKSAEETA